MTYVMLLPLDIKTVGGHIFTKSDIEHLFDFNFSEEDKPLVNTASQTYFGKALSAEESKTLLPDSNRLRMQMRPFLKDVCVRVGNVAYDHELNAVCATALPYGWNRRYFADILENDKTFRMHPHFVLAEPDGENPSKIEEFIAFDVVVEY